MSATGTGSSTSRTRSSKGKTKTYRQPVPALWWASRWPYLRFMLREMTSIPIVAFLILLLGDVARLGSGSAGFGLLRSPLGIAVSVLALAGSIFHSVTWHMLSAQIFGIRLSEDYEVPRSVVMAVNFGAWVVVSIILGVWICR